MNRPRAIASIVASAVLVAVAAGCGGGPAASQSPTAGPSAEPTATPSATQAGTPFELTVVPAMSIGRTIPHARVVFLVTISGTPADGAVEITAQASNTTTTVEPSPLLPGVVGEVTVIPKDCPCNETQTGVTIAAVRDGVVREEMRTIEIVSGTDDWATDAAAHLAPFIAWLEANRPDLGITAQTEWTGTPGSWVLVVNHYLYFSDDWELDLEWHVMIPPDDWSRIYLRKRWEEVAPSVAFEISSVAGNTEPKEIEPPDAVWR